MQIMFLGSGASVPDVGNDCPCFLINEKYLIDCGYNVLSALREHNCDISKIEYIIFTHMHHDHYIGLAGLLFYMMQSKCKDIGDLKIIGPGDLEDILERTYRFLLLDKHYQGLGRPTAFPLAVGETFETDDATIKTGDCYHPVDARCYRFYDKVSGKTVAITGDTAFKEDMAELFSGADAVIHDCTLGTGNWSDDPKTRLCGHSTIFEGIKLCELANIPLLFPMHMNTNVALEAIDKVKHTTNIKIIHPKIGLNFLLN